MIPFSQFFPSENFFPHKMHRFHCCIKSATLNLLYSPFYFLKILIGTLLFNQKKISRLTNNIPSAGSYLFSSRKVGHCENLKNDGFSITTCDLIPLINAALISLSLSLLLPTQQSFQNDVTFSLKSLLQREYTHDIELQAKITFGVKFSKERKLRIRYKLYMFFSF